MEGVVGPRHDCTIRESEDLGRHGVLMRVFVRMCVIFLFFFCLVSPLSPVKKSHHTTIFAICFCIFYPLACKTTMIKRGWWKRHIRRLYE